MSVNTTIVERVMSCVNWTALQATIRDKLFGDIDTRDTVVESISTTPNYRKTAHYQENSLVYIVVVLLFYSLSIVIIMIKYMKAEQREMQESKQYTEYLEYRDKPQQAKDKSKDKFAVLELLKRRDEKKSGGLRKYSVKDINKDGHEVQALCRGTQHQNTKLEIV